MTNRQYFLIVLFIAYVGWSLAVMWSQRRALDDKNVYIDGGCVGRCQGAE